MKDYSLPSVVSLPKLPVFMAVDKEPVASATAKPTSGTQAENTDDEYDMLEDDYNPVALLENKVESMTVADVAQTPRASPEMETETQVPQQPAASSHPFIDALKKEADEQFDRNNLTTTENNATTFRSTKDARLDFFFEVLQKTDMDTIHRLARDSWRVSPLDTLRLIFQLRSILDGKGDREGFYHCLNFLRREHPKTLLYNLRFVPDHGYWKDLLNWLASGARIENKEMGFAASTAKAMGKTKARPEPVRSSRGRGRDRGRGTSSTSRSIPLLSREHVERIERASKRPKVEKKEDDDDAETETETETEADTETEAETAQEKAKRERAEKAAENQRQHEARQKEESDKARELRRQKTKKRLERARTLFGTNEFYRSAHIEIARLFARALKRDKANMEAGKPVTLVAKWCPSLDQYHDKHTLIATTIAQILFPDRLENEEHETYIRRIRQLLRTEYYVPLRKATPVLETFMSASQWNEIPYSRVPAIAMKKNKPHFELHDVLRFKEYLDSVTKGESTIAAAALMPHELVVESRTARRLPVDDPKRRTMELQWTSYVERLKKNPGQLHSCMAMCDVSGSMGGTPMDVAIALSLLLSELTEPPFNSMILSFSASPVIHQVNHSESLVDKVTNLERMDWGMNTNFQKAFQMILDVAVKNNLAQDQMVKTLFVFSDMEFDVAVGRPHQSSNGEPFTNYNAIKKSFREKGYDLPQIIFWNLRASASGNKPVLSTQPGVGMISGYSGMMMKVFLKGDDLLEKLDPIRLMEESINGKAFAKLKVID
ncbi:hypothetical protein BGZ73_007182 [Actinomortierella ambigua]|nr:hypothetical protein BGZ73_007182 [Actinomortierella ambigua]